MQPFDCVVIGGGIVGLAAAREILEKRPGIRIALLEKEESLARHQTGRNSGVIHSVIYYKPGSLKAGLCRAGRRRLTEFCGAHGIRHDLCGKVIVATSESELPRLNGLYERGLTNGLNVRKLCSDEVEGFEPHVRCVAGIWVPETGIVDFVGVCQKLRELIESRGGELRLGTKVNRIQTREGETVLETTKEDVK